MAKIKLFVTTGCYLGLNHRAVELEYDDSMDVSRAIKLYEQDIYEESAEECRGWIGLHGFGPDEDDEDWDEFDEDEYIEQYNDWAVEPWDEKEHRDHCHEGDGEFVQERVFGS